MDITSDKACQHAKTSKPREDFPVSGVKGLMLRVTHSGQKTWSLRYRRKSDGKRRRFTIGEYPATSLQDAGKRARAEFVKIDRGGDPAGEKQDLRQVSCFERLAEQWVAFKRRQGRSSSYLKRSEERLAILPLGFREMKVTDIKRVHITAALDAVAKRGAKTETNRQQALISAVLKWAVSEGLLDDDPSRGIKRRFKEEARERCFTDDEVRAFWFGIDTAPCSQATRIAMRLCFVLGQRPKEIAHLRKDELTLDALHPTATISKEIAKNRTQHIVPLPRLAVDLLREAIALAPDSEWVFPRPDGEGPIDPHCLAVAIYRARDSKTGDVFGVHAAQLYDAKRTIATYLGDQGHPDQFIGLLFNHLTAKGGTITGKHYNHSIYMNQKRAMIEQWASHLGAVLEIAPLNPAPADTVVPMRRPAS
jgi:integrase